MTTNLIELAMGKEFKSNQHDFENINQNMSLTDV